MKKKFFISLLVCVFLVACSGASNISTVLPFRTPEPVSTATNNTISPLSSTPTNFTATIPSTSTLTMTPTSSQPIELSPTSIYTPFPMYHNKGFIFDYYVVGNMADWGIFFDPPSGNIVTNLVLYEDGQMLVAGTGETYKQKILSSAEINSFLSKLKTLGFYSIESNQQHDQTDNLYDFGNNYQELHDGLWYCVSIDTDQSRSLCVREPYIQFLIPKMKGILEYLDEYEPAEMTPYIPDRILLQIQSNLDHSIEIPPATPWNERFPSLEYNPNRFTSDTNNQVIFIEGDMAKEISLFFAGSKGWKVVSQNGNEFIVSIRVLLPHEKVRNPQ